MKIFKKSPILQKLALSAELVLKSPAFGPAALALAGIAVVGTVGCSGGSNTPDKKPDPTPQPTPQQLEEARRLAEFNRLSAPANKIETIIYVEKMEDFKVKGFGYNSDNHIVTGCKFVVSPTVTDPALKAQLGKEAESLNNNFLVYLWNHELKHETNAKYRITIKEPKNRWKIEFLDETSAYIVQDSVKNILAMSLISSNEATQLMFEFFNFFSDLFDKSDSVDYRTVINYRAFSGSKPIDGISYDSDEWFMTGLNAFFTYKIGDKDVNLFELMTPADREAFLTKLNTKMQQEYDRYHSGYYD